MCGVTAISGRITHRFGSTPIIVTTPSRAAIAAPEIYNHRIREGFERSHLRHIAVRKLARGQLRPRVFRLRRQDRRQRLFDKGCAVGQILNDRQAAKRHEIASLL